MAKIDKETIQEVFGLLTEILDVSAGDVLPELRKINNKSIKKGEQRTAMVTIEWNGLAFEGGKGFVSGKKGVKTGKTKKTQQKEKEQAKQKKKQELNELAEKLTSKTISEESY